MIDFQIYLTTMGRLPKTHMLVVQGTQQKPIKSCIKVANVHLESYELEEPSAN